MSGDIVELLGCVGYFMIYESTEDGVTVLRCFPAIGVNDHGEKIQTWAMYPLDAHHPLLLDDPAYQIKEILYPSRHRKP